MTKKHFIEALHIEAKKALEGFREGSFFFQDYDFGIKIPYRLDFCEWIEDLEDYLDVDPTELQDENRFETIKRFFPTLDNSRVQNLIAEPKSITDDESLE